MDTTSNVETKDDSTSNIETKDDQADITGGAIKDVSQEKQKHVNKSLKALSESYEIYYGEYEQADMEFTHATEDLQNINKVEDPAQYNKYENFVHEKQNNVQKYEELLKFLHDLIELAHKLLTDNSDLIAQIDGLVDNTTPKVKLTRLRAIKSSNNENL